MMKKIFVLLSCCFLIMTFCTASSTVDNVYLNTFPIMLNGTNYSPILPILSYQNRTYLPLAEFSILSGNKVSFTENTIFISSNYKELFYLFKYTDNLYDTINQMNEYITEAISCYYACSSNKSFTSSTNDFLKLFNEKKEAIDIILSDKITFVRYCLSQNILTLDEADKLLQDIETIAYDFDLTQKKISYYLENKNYAENVHSTYEVPNKMSSDVTTKLLKLKIKIDEKYQ